MSAHLPASRAPDDRNQHLRPRDPHLRLPVRKRAAAQPDRVLADDTVLHVHRMGQPVRDRVQRRQCLPERVPAGQPLRRPRSDQGQQDGHRDGERNPERYRYRLGHGCGRDRLRWSRRRGIDRDGFARQRCYPDAGERQLRGIPCPYGQCLCWSRSRAIIKAS